MKFNHTNTDHIKDAYQDVEERVGDFFGSSLYNEEWARYQVRRDAYYCRHRSNVAHWRSKLHLATFWLSIKALEAQQVQAYSQWPLVHVGATDDSQIDPGAEEKSQLLQADLNYDLQASRFDAKLKRMLWWVNLKGHAVGREYIRSESQSESMQLAMGGRVDQIRRTEKTVTMPIHPLNYAHDITCSDFVDSPWGAVRYEVPISEIYKMRGNSLYNQQGVRELLKKVEDNKGAGSGYSYGKTTFYTDHGDISTMRRHYIVLEEYNGPVHTKNNLGNDQRYYMLYCRPYNLVLRISPSPFKLHPYWKMQAHPDPDGPFSVGPCDMVLPINEWENSTVNQYNDYVNASLKFLYKVKAENIVGGAMSLIDGLPMGLVQIEDDETGQAWGQAIEPIRQNMGTIPPVSDAVALIDKYKEQQGVSSNQRGIGSDQLSDTATGITMMARREDAMTQALLDGLDRGVEDGMSIKIEFMTKFFKENRVVPVEYNGQSRYVEHFPYELAGLGWVPKAQRQTPDVEIAKNMSFLKFLASINQLAGAPVVPPQVLIKAAKRVGMSIGVSGADEMFGEIMQGMQQQPMSPPQQGQQQPGPQQMPDMDGTANMNQEAAAMGQGAMAAAMV